MASRTALVVGATGIVGLNLATHLAGQRDWRVYGLARNPTAGEGVQPVAADLLEPDTLRGALRGIAPTHVFLTSWLRQPTEAENIKVNSAMVRNLLEAVSPAGTLQHAALVTGLKHYLGPFEAYGKGTLPATPFREEQPRLDIDNFYYAQEDELFVAAHRHNFGWSIHRPHTIIGRAVGNAMNMGVTLAVYATICRATGQPFRFPGSAMQWNGLTDMTDADLLARREKLLHGCAEGLIGDGDFGFERAELRIAVEIPPLTAQGSIAGLSLFPGAVGRVGGRDGVLFPCRSSCGVRTMVVGAHGAASEQEHGCAAHKRRCERPEAEANHALPSGPPWGWFSS